MKPVKETVVFAAHGTIQKALDFVERNCREIVIKDRKTLPSSVVATYKAHDDNLGSKAAGSVVTIYSTLEDRSLPFANIIIISNGAIVDCYIKDSNSDSTSHGAILFYEDGYPAIDSGKLSSILRKLRHKNIGKQKAGYDVDEDIIREIVGKVLQEMRFASLHEDAVFTGHSLPSLLPFKGNGSNHYNLSKTAAIGIGDALIDTAWATMSPITIEINFRIFSKYATWAQSTVTPRWVEWNAQLDKLKNASGDYAIIDKRQSAVALIMSHGILSTINNMFYKVNSIGAEIRDELWSFIEHACKVSNAKQKMKLVMDELQTIYDNSRTGGGFGPVTYGEEITSTEHVITDDFTWLLNLITGMKVMSQYYIQQLEKSNRSLKPQKEAIGSYRRYNYYNDRPVVIHAKFASKCAETSKPIKRGEQVLYFPQTKKVYSMDSKTASEWRSSNAASTFELADKDW